MVQIISKKLLGGIQMRLFHKKKPIDETEEEIRKYHRRQRNKIRLLLEEYNKGKILRPDEDIDNKEYLKSKEVQ